tara:strand:- start:162 stop:665 length:504 start_codon:yes stop_codon:yes gene_type:complete
MSYTPDAPYIYQGKQIIIDSDRLIFNAKNDSILLFSDKAIGFSTNGSFHFDTSDKKDSKFIVNSPNIYFGLKDGDLPTEPVILGHKFQEWMIGDPNKFGGIDKKSPGLLDVLDDILDMILSEIEFLSPSGPTTPSAKNIATIKDRQVKLKELHNRFKETLSNKVKTV